MRYRLHTKYFKGFKVIRRVEHSDWFHPYIGKVEHSDLHNNNPLIGLPLNETYCWTL